MISFITDDKPGESVILEPLRFTVLRVIDLEGQHIETIPAPAKGWTHEILVATSQQLETKTSNGADAYLGGIWVGSSEVLSLEIVTKEDKLFAKAGAAICLIPFLVFLYWIPILAPLALFPLLLLLPILKVKVGDRVKLACR